MCDGLCGGVREPLYDVLSSCVASCLMNSRAGLCDVLCEVCVWGSWCDRLCSVGGTVRSSHVQIALEFEEVNQTLLTGWLAQ